MESFKYQRKIKSIVNLSLVSKKFLKKLVEMPINPENSIMLVNQSLKKQKHIFMTSKVVLTIAKFLHNSLFYRIFKQKKCMLTLLMICPFRHRLIDNIDIAKI
ncbi:hypothetical protein BpHYR1_036356 [Brachionus plicatilis]|uniref:Uncharacterized protein n=1 Tax=Brachionus plicatilis TaxID=10195 RepID=A0A3M7QEV5_BRAPC|nr:hypothetical protein BpHYR1_036356 [Brachionus plicatilis]